MTGDQAKDAHLIGQFGVGFYSSFIVADKVTLITRRAGLTAEHGVRWESAARAITRMETVEKTGRGTEVILHLREGEDDLLIGWRLRTIIRKYSDHITLPIVMKKEEWTRKRSENVVTDEDETVNQASALWARPKAEITEEQYKEFYKHVAHDFEPPLAYCTPGWKASRNIRSCSTFRQRAPFDLWDREQRHGIKLYVRRVFIMDDAEQLMPAYLRFVRGVIDSSDLPLNVSREILQESRDVEDHTRRRRSKGAGPAGRTGAKRAEPKQIRDILEGIRPGNQGRVGGGHANRERIAKLLRFASTHADYRRADRVAGRLHRRA